MLKNNETLPIGSLIDSSVFAQSLKSGRFQILIKHSTIFSFWGDIVGRKFEKYTIPYAIKNSVLYVSAKSPVVVQELSLNKKVLIKKTNTYSMPLGIKVKDIVFNYKNFETLSSKASEENYVEDSLIWYKDDELKNHQIDNDIVGEIEKSVHKINFLNEEQKQKLIQKIVLNQKAKMLRKIDNNK